LVIKEFLYLFYVPDITSDEINEVVEAAEKTNVVEVELAGALDLFEHCFHLSRQQFEAGCLLREFKRHTKDFKGKKIWIVSQDLFAPGLNFVFGQAELGGEVAIVSTSRLRTGAPSETMYFQRLRTEVVHELLHLLGLDHCPNPYCVMYFSNSLSDTDRKGEETCIVCAERLRLKYEK